ncbi:MAG: CBS domain-containing protein, partial [Nitrospiraceae bacterium]
MTARENRKSDSEGDLRNNSVLYRISSFQYSETLENMMDRDVYSCSAGDTVKLVAKEMTLRGISSVIVTDAHGKPVGIVTERDMVRKVVAEGDICD